MDLGSPSLCVCVMMACLLGAARCSTGGENKCECQEIPQFRLTEDPSTNCSGIATSFRYTCIEGYVRKAGTSNHITCNEDNGTWTKPTLECIRENKCKCHEIPPVHLTEDPSTKCSGTTTSFRYTCIEGYLRKAGTSNRVTCNENIGIWTKPNLECIPDPRRPPPPKPDVTRENKCKCHEIPPVRLTEDPPTNCSGITTSFRYTCIEGYVRKAGTSNHITCNENNATWTKPTLECIPDPKRPPPPNTTVTQGYTEITLDIVTTTISSSTSPPGLTSIAASTSVTAATERAEATSPDLHVSSNHSTQVNPVTKTEETEKSTSTSTTTEPSVFNPADSRKLGNTQTALITLASLMIVCALIGLAFKKYYRRSKENADHQPSEEEQMPMNQYA